MKNILFFFVISIVSCNSNDSESSVTKATEDTPATKPKNIQMPEGISGCYSYVLKKDSALLKLNISGDKVSGDLTYNLYEKDHNRGTIDGTVQDSLVIADYTFQSEGMTSVRQVVFKINGDSLFEGFGDIDMINDTARFKNISQLKFYEQRPFLKTACK
ncbi:MAG: hypothetical protein ABJA90_04310 [Ginsengibacter sp.]